MAVLGEFKVEIIIDGQVAKEYDDEKPPDPIQPATVVKYIEATSGVQFEFKKYIGGKYRAHKGEVIDAVVYLDGKWQASWIFSAQSLMKNHDIQASSPGRYSTTAGKVIFYPFRFADLETREMDSGHLGRELVEMYKDVGTLRVEFKRAKHKSSSYESGDGGFVPDALETIPEKALKGQSIKLATTFGKPQSAPRQTFLTVEQLQQPALAIFCFKYRTRNALQMLGMIERSPSPIPLEERPVDELTREELQLAVQNLREQRDRNQAIKQENIKREHSPPTSMPTQPLKKTKGPRGEVIYHLDSD